MRDKWRGTEVSFDSLHSARMHHTSLTQAVRDRTSVDAGREVERRGEDSDGGQLHGFEESCIDLGVSCMVEGHRSVHGDDCPS